jgi:hypothetical protein
MDRGRNDGHDQRGEEKRVECLCPRFSDTCGDTYGPPSREYTKDSPPEVELKAKSAYTYTERQGHGAVGLGTWLPNGS